MSRHDHLRGRRTSPQRCNGMTLLDARPHTAELHATAGRRVWASLFYPESADVTGLFEDLDASGWHGDSHATGDGLRFAAWVHPQGGTEWSDDERDIHIGALRSAFAAHGFAAGPVRSR